MRRCLLLLAAASACAAVSPPHQNVLELKTEFIAQQTPSWCWAATASMALKSVGFPEIDGAKNYQCAVVAVAFPRCADDCTKCDNTLDTMFSFVRLLNSYRDRVQQGAPVGLQQSFDPTYVAYPALGQIEQSLQRRYPVIAGISTHVRPLNPASPEHAVLITGYDGDYKGTGEPWVILRDPFPYERGENPWADEGLPYQRATGRVVVPWHVLRDRMNLTSAVFLEKISTNSA